MLKSVFFRRLVIMLSVAMLIAAAVMLGGYVFLSKDVYADIKLDELHPVSYTHLTLPTNSLV